MAELLACALIRNGKYMHKFLSDIDILTSPLTYVIKKILITSRHTFNTARNSICYDIIVKKVNTVFFCLDNSKCKIRTTKPRQKEASEQSVNSE